MNTDQSTDPDVYVIENLLKNPFCRRSVDEKVSTALYGQT